MRPRCDAPRLGPERRGSCPGCESPSSIHAEPMRCRSRDRGPPEWGTMDIITLATTWGQGRPRGGAAAARGGRPAAHEAAQQLRSRLRSRPMARAADVEATLRRAYWDSLRELKDNIDRLLFVCLLYTSDAADES